MAAEQDAAHRFTVVKASKGDEGSDDSKDAEADLKDEVI